MSQALKRFGRNTVANYIGVVGTVLSAFILTPLIVNGLGLEGYGAWTVVLSVTGYLVMLDFGLGSALTKYVAEAEQNGDHARTEELASTLTFVFLGVGLAAFLVMAAVALNVPALVQLPTGLGAPTTIAVIILGINFAFSLMFNVQNALVVAYQRFDLLNAVALLAVLLNFILTVLALRLGWSLPGLALAITGTTLLKTLALRWTATRWERRTRLRLSLVRRKHVTLLVSFSALVFLMMLCNMVERNTQPLIIGRALGLAAVAQYGVGDKVGGLVRQFSAPITYTLFPAFAALSAVAELSSTRTLLVQGLRISALVGIPAAAIAIVLSEPLIRYWIGPEFVASAPIAVVMCLQALVAQQQMASSSLLTGQGKLTRYAFMHFVAVAISLTFSIIFTPRWGPVAAALAGLLAWGLVLAFALAYTARLTHAPLPGVLATAYARPVAVTLLVCLPLTVLVQRIPPRSLIQVLLLGGGAAAAYLLLAWFFCLTRNERGGVRRRLKRLRWAVSARSAI